MAMGVWLWVSLAVGVLQWGAGPAGSDRASCVKILSFCDTAHPNIAQIPQKQYELCPVCRIFVHSSEAPVILAEKTAISSATIAVFRDFPLFFVVLDNPCRKYPRFFCENLISEVWEHIDYCPRNDLGDSPRCLVTYLQK